MMEGNVWDLYADCDGVWVQGRALVEGNVVEPAEAHVQFALDDDRPDSVFVIGRRVGEYGQFAQLTPCGTYVDPLLAVDVRCREGIWTFAPGMYEEDIAWPENAVVTLRAAHGYSMGLTIELPGFEDDDLVIYRES
jgi:hypothetical protein